MDLNCDLGEWETPARTAGLMRRITSANIACGGHAGSVESMERCVKLAAQYGVNIGAHPGIAGEQGRGNADFTESAFLQLLISQTATLKVIANERGRPLTHIKLHGALYHWSEQKPHAGWYVKGVKRYFPGVRIFSLPHGRVCREARRHGVPVWREVFGDRSYRADGSLMPRGQNGAVLTDTAQVRSRLCQLLETGSMSAADETLLSMPAETICIHGDTPNAIALATVAAKVLNTQSRE